MSHIEKVDVVVEDLDALAAAAATLGMELVPGQATYKWFGTWLNDWPVAERAAALKGHDPATFGQCEHAIRVKNGGPDAYEIGVVRSVSGNGYDLLYDAWGNGGGAITKRCGRSLTDLADHYIVEVGRRELEAEGYEVTVQRNEAGELEAVGQKVGGRR